MTSDYDGEIARRAYIIWEDEGRPSGRELDHWLRAEAEVKAERTQSTTQAPKSPQRLEAVPTATAATAKPQRPAPRRARRT